MPVPHFQFEDEDWGLPRQPVPFRMVPRMMDLRVKELLSLMVEGSVGFPVYDFDPKYPEGQITPNDLRLLKACADAAEREPDAVTCIPASYYVWSDAVPLAFSAYVDNTVGREDAWETGMCVTWRPALGEILPLVEECPDLSSLLGTKESTAPAPENRFVYAGNKWQVTFDGNVRDIRSRKGYLAIATLLRNPDHLIPVEELDALLNPSKDLGDSTYSKSLHDRVAKNIKDAREPLEREFPSLYQHLLSHLKTGRDCVYRPVHPTSWHVELPPTATE